jgi:hypothetical protein
MTRRIAVRQVGETEYAIWNKMIASSAGGSIYSTPEYLDIFCGAAGGKFRLLAADRGGELVGGIALCEHETSWGKYLGGRYLLYYNGFVVKPHASKYPSERVAKTIETLSALEEAVRTAGYGRVSIRSRSLCDVRVFKSTGWRAVPSYTYVVPLTDVQTQWARVEQNLRRLVTRCVREDFQFTDDDDFDSYHQFHLATAARKQAGVYLPEGAYKRYFERLRKWGHCHLFHARLPDGRAISSQLVLTGMHPVWHMVSAAADAAHLHTGATAFLRWKGFEKLANLGASAVDLTDAEINPVTHFKSQFGGELQLNFLLTRPDAIGFAIESSLKSARSAAGSLAARVGTVGKRAQQNGEQRS